MFKIDLDRNVEELTGVQAGMLFEYSKALQKENQELREVAQRFINIQEGTNGDIGTETYKQFKQLLTKNN